MRKQEISGLIDQINSGQVESVRDELAIKVKMFSVESEDESEILIRKFLNDADDYLVLNQKEAAVSSLRQVKELLTA